MLSVTRRAFTKFSISAIAAKVAPVTVLQPENGLKSELLFDLDITAQAPESVGNGRLVVPVAGGRFTGPRLSGTIMAPAGDWIVERSDHSRVLDVRAMMKTDDGQFIYLSWRGIAYTTPSGELFARILPAFETGAPKYAWINNVIAVGVYRNQPGGIGYRVYSVL